MSDRLNAFLRQKKVVIHLGAHKTATTYLQSLLGENREELASRGAALLLRKDLRDAGVRLGKKRKQVSMQPDADTALDLAGLIAERTRDPGTERIILSEENLIGSTGNNLLKKALYPGLARRLRVLPKTLNHPNVTLMLGIRDYGSFFSSNVTTAVRRGSLYDMSALRTSLLVPGRGWLDVVSELQDAFPLAELRLWRYEAFPSIEARVLDVFVPGFAPEPQDRKFQTLSRDAMGSIAATLGSGHSEATTRQVIRTAIQRFPLSGSNPPFSLWSEDEAAHMTRRYEADWQALRHRIPGFLLE